MRPKTFERHVPWDDAVTWARFHAGAGHAPDAVLAWVEETLTGKWSHRQMSTAEIVKVYGHAASGQSVFEFAFAETGDGTKFIVAFGAPARTA